MLFLYTSAINVITLILAGVALFLGLPGPGNPLLSIVPAAVGGVVLVLFLLLPRYVDRIIRRVRPGRLHTVLTEAAASVRDTKRLTFHPGWRIIGAIGCLWFDIAVPFACFAGRGPAAAAGPGGVGVPDRLPIELHPGAGRDRHARSLWPGRDCGNRGHARLPRDFAVGAGPLGHDRVHRGAENQEAAARSERPSRGSAGRAPLIYGRGSRRQQACFALRNSPSRSTVARLKRAQGEHRATPGLSERTCRCTQPVRSSARGTSARTPHGAGTVASMRPNASNEVADRGVERRRAVALARHYREFEGPSIAQIGDRLGRSPATIKAYFYDPSHANKGPSWEREAEPGGRELRSHPPAAASRGDVLPPTDVFLRSDGCPAPPVGLGFSCSAGSRNGAARRNSPATTATRRVWRSRRSLVGWDAQKQPSRAISTIQPAIMHAQSRRARGECVAAAGRPPHHGTARATPTRIANAAIPARSRRNGHGNGFAKRCAHGERATALRPPPMTGRAPTHAGAAAKRSNDYRSQNGPHRRPSPISTAAGRRPAPTPSPALERPGHNAVVIWTLALRLVICERGRRRSPHTPRPFVSVAAARRSGPVAAASSGATASCACKPPRIGRRQGHRRLSQPRQSGSAARSPTTPGWPARRTVAQVAKPRAAPAL